MNKSTIKSSKKYTYGNMHKSQIFTQCAYVLARFVCYVTMPFRIRISFDLFSTVVIAGVVVVVFNQIFRNRWYLNRFFLCVRYYCCYSRRSGLDVSFFELFYALFSVFCFFLFIHTIFYVHFHSLVPFLLSQSVCFFLKIEYSPKCTHPLTHAINMLR